MTIFLPLMLGSGWTAMEPCVRHEQAAIVMECESNGYYSQPYDLSSGLHAEVDVLAYAKSGDGRFWASVAINHDIPADDRYASAGIEQGIAPYWGDTQPYAIHLSTPANRCCDRLAPIDASQWHHIIVDYYHGEAIYSVDGYTQAVNIDLGDTASVELLCVAVDPGESKPTNIARCEYRNVVISQSTAPKDTQSPRDSTKLWLPVILQPS